MYHFFTDLTQYLIPYLGSNIIAIILVLTAFIYPRFTKWIFAIIFLWAAIINLTTARATPEVYLEYASLSIVPVYKTFILEFFSRHITEIVSTIAVGQLIISVLLIQKQRYSVWGIIGAIVFLILIAPLGVGSAFPATILMAIALYQVHKNITVMQHVEENHAYENLNHI